MITRPLDLASKLRPEPRTLYWLFFVNAGLLGLFFSLFGSRFVLAPGLGMDFRLPTVAGANANARAPTHVIGVLGSGQILTSAGRQTLPGLARWLEAQAAGTPSPLLLVQLDGNVPTSVFTEITSVARQAGFETMLAARDTEPAAQPRR